MKISKKLPQFDLAPAIFLVTGEYEAKFYLVRKGSIEKLEHIKYAPREDAREKQIYEYKVMKRLAATSHEDKYLVELKNKFYRKIDKILYDLIAIYKIKGIYIFTPDYVWEKITENLEKHSKEKIRRIFYGEFTKLNPKQIVEIFKKKYFPNIKEIKSGEEEKILKKPRIKLETAYKVEKKSPKK